MVTIRSPLCGYNTAWCVELNGDDVSCYSNKIESFRPSLRKCPSLTCRQSVLILSVIAVTNIDSRSFTYTTAAKMSTGRDVERNYVTVTPCIYFSDHRCAISRNSPNEAPLRGSDMELGHWVTGSMGHLGHLSRSGHRVIILTRCETRVFFRFSKKCPKCKTYIWNAEMTKVIVRCLLLDWNHWTSVHAMNFYFYLWLLKNLRPENTSSHISHHLEFITEQGHRVNWVSGSLDSRVTGSLGHKTQFRLWRGYLDTPRLSRRSRTAHSARQVVCQRTGIDGRTDGPTPPWASCPPSCRHVPSLPRLVQLKGQSGRTNAIRACLSRARPHPSARSLYTKRRQKTRQRRGSGRRGGRASAGRRFHRSTPNLRLSSFYDRTSVRHPYTIGLLARCVPSTRLMHLPTARPDQSAHVTLTLRIKKIIYRGPTKY